MRITAHANEQRHSRGITFDEIRETLRAPERARPSASDDTCYIFTKHVEQDDGTRRRIKVVFSFRYDGDTSVVTVGDGPERRESRTVEVNDAVLACAALSTRAPRDVVALEREPESYKALNLA